MRTVVPCLYRRLKVRTGGTLTLTPIVKPDPTTTLTLRDRCAVPGITVEQRK